jgi:type II secretory pathway pseudopilin PulG
MVPMRAHRGAALLELVVAIPLVLLVGALAVQLFTAQLRVAGVQESRLAVARELEHAALALAADLRPLAARDLDAWSDSGVVAHVPVLVGYACGAPAGDVVDVAVGDSGRASRAMMIAEPSVGDQLAWSAPDTAVQGLDASILDSSLSLAVVGGVERAAAACVGSPLRGSASPWRLRLAASPVLPPEPASLVVVRRRVEWRVYRASDGAHYLGRRDWNGSAWTTVQPVAGPLHAPATGGFVLRVLRADGTPASPARADARMLVVTLRAPRRAAAAIARDDSLVVRLSLRGGR